MSLDLVVALQKLFVDMEYGNKSVLNPVEVVNLIVDDSGKNIIFF